LRRCLVKERLSTWLHQRSSLTGRGNSGLTCTAGARSTVTSGIRILIPDYMLPSGVHTTNCMRRSTSCTACAPHTCTCRCRMQMPAPESRCYTHTHTHTHRTVIPRLHYTTGCQTACTTALTTVFNKQPLFVQPVVKPGCTTVLTTGLTTGCIHDTAGCQTGCQTGLTTG